MATLEKISVKDTPDEKCEKLARWIVQAETLDSNKLVRVMRLMFAQEIPTNLLAEHVEYEYLATFGEEVVS